METQEFITKTDGAPFGSKASLMSTLHQKGLIGTYKAAEHEGGGFVGVPKRADEVEDVTVEPKSEPEKPKTVMVRVHRTNVDPENSGTQISICANNPKNRKRFFPGEEVELTQTEIGILKDSVEETQLVIPPDSGIYQAKEPLAVARNQYPGMQPRYDSITGMILMVKRTPNYLIENVT